MVRLFGTNGIRGVVNEDMNCELALRIGKAWGTYLKKNHSNPRVAIGSDARLSNHMLKSSVIAGFLATGCDVTDIGLLPTPGIQYVVREKGFDAGVAITASHNPPEFNGIKGINRDGTEYYRDTEEEIESIYFSEDFKLVSWDKVGRLDNWDGGVDLYLKGILDQVDVGLIRKKRFHVVLDCGSGAGSVITPVLLEKLGCRLTKLYCIPDGRFPGHNSEPTPENLEELMKTVPLEEADFGVAQDGDADRAIFIDEHGNYIWGDKTLTLMTKYILIKEGGGIVVTPVTTSQCIDDVAEKYNGKVIRTRVGSPTVARVMKQEGAVFGGEENGGLIFPRFQYCRDSVMTIAKMLELLAEEDKTISEVIKDIPSYEVIKTKIHCPNEKKEEVLRKITAIAKKDEDVIKVETIDGVKIFTENGWVLVRPSGTEPIYRIYGESRDKSKVEKLVDYYRKLVEEIITSLD